MLAPILFDLYTMKLFHDVSGLDLECQSYADDAQLLLSVIDQQQAEHDFCETMNIVQSWMKKWEIVLNTGKYCLCILFYSSRQGCSDRRRVRGRIPLTLLTIKSLGPVGKFSQAESVNNSKVPTLSSMNQNVVNTKLPTKIAVC